YRSQYRRSPRPCDIHPPELRDSAIALASVTQNRGLTVAAATRRGGRMKKTMWTGTATAIVAAATVAAMAQAPGAQQSSGRSVDKRVTVTGCLKAAPPSAADAGTTTAPTGTTGTTGTAGAASGAADAKFVLTEATTSPASNDPSSSTTTA